MKHISLLTLCFLTFTVTSMAKKVDPQTAKRVGINFYFERLSQNTQVNYHDITVRESYTESLNGNPVYYTFNFEGSGFVVVSADNSVTPVLAYSFDGTFNTEGEPPQFKSWMEGYAKQIDYSVQQKLSGTPEINQEWERLSASNPASMKSSTAMTEVIPLLISTWDQGNPYNILCPADGAGPGGHVWSGCVATAMSQVMYYWRWPNTGAGQHCYYPSGYAEQCADFANTTYKWNEMMTVLNSQCNDTAGALLQWHAGISVDMMYAPGGSGAYSEDATNSMVSNFRYIQNTDLLYKSDYTESAWAAILRDNLDHRKPMYYDGFGSGGHAFNVDGYQGTDYFHFNWGWSGSYNGYFYLNNLNPGGSNFTEGQGAMVNIYPDTINNNYPAYCSGQQTLTSLTGTFEDGSGPAKNYHANANCGWLISPHSISDSVISITINFNRFKTEPTSDVVNIYKGSTTGDSLVASYSGASIPPAVVVQGNKALVTFTTNGSVSNEGWYISYTSQTLDWCSGTKTLTDLSGNISDGSLGFNYKNRTNCMWKIVPEGAGALIFTLSEFQSEPVYDALSIYDYGTGQLISKVSGSFSSSSIPGPFVASSGKMFLLWTTNGSSTGQGWEGTYSTFPVGCNELTDPTSVLTYPNPVTSHFTIRVNDSKVNGLKYELCTLDGKVILKDQIMKGTVEQNIPVSGLARGIYILRLVTENETATRKIVIQ